MQAAAARNAWAVAVAVAWAEPHAAAGGGCRRRRRRRREEGSGRDAVCVCARDPPTVPQVTDGRFGGALNQKSVQTMQTNATRRGRSRSQSLKGH